MNKKDKIIISSSAALFLILAVGVNVFNHMDKKSLGSLSVSNTITEVSSENSTEPEESIKPEPVSSEETVSEDETTSKDWFDLRNLDGDKKSLMDKLVKDITTSLTSGSLPQVITSFPLVYVEGNEVGFKRDNITIDGNNMEVITIVGPDSMGKDKVRVLFRKGSEVLDLGTIPFIFSDYGISGKLLVLGGDNIDPSMKDFLTLTVVNPYTMEKVDITPLSNTKVDFSRRNGYITVKSSYDNYYFYTEYENEGIKDNNLYLVLEGKEQDDYFNYAFVVKDNQLTLEEQEYGTTN